VTSPEELYSFRSLWRQYRACRRNKRGTLNALAFEADAEANLLQLQAELRDHTYRPGRRRASYRAVRSPERCSRRIPAEGPRRRWATRLLVAQQAPD